MRARGLELLGELVERALTARNGDEQLCEPYLARRALECEPCAALRFGGPPDLIQGTGSKGLKLRQIPAGLHGSVEMRDHELVVTHGNWPQIERRIARLFPVCIVCIFDW